MIFDCPSYQKPCKVLIARINPIDVGFSRRNKLIDLGQNSCGAYNVTTNSRTRMKNFDQFNVLNRNLIGCQHFFHDISILNINISKTHF